MKCVRGEMPSVQSRVRPLHLPPEHPGLLPETALLQFLHTAPLLDPSEQRFQRLRLFAVRKPRCIRFRR